MPSEGTAVAASCTWGARHCVLLEKDAFSPGLFLFMRFRYSLGTFSRPQAGGKLWFFDSVTSILQPEV